MPNLPDPPHRLIRCSLGGHPQYSPMRFASHRNRFYPADSYHETWIITGTPRSLREQPSAMTLHVVETLQSENDRAGADTRWSRLTNEKTVDQVDRGLVMLRGWFEDSSPAYPVHIEGRELRYGPGAGKRIDLAHPSLQVALFHWFHKNRGMTSLLTEFEDFRYIFCLFVESTTSAVSLGELRPPKFPPVLHPYTRVELVPPENWIRLFSTTKEST